MLKTVLIIFFSLPIPLLAQNTYSLKSGTLKVTEVKNNLTIPWEIVWGPDQHIWLTHNQGTISRLNPKTGELINLIKVSDIYPGNSLTDTRMMGLALHPDFENKPFVFTNYTYKGDSYTDLNWDKYLKIVRYEYNSEENKLENPFVVIENIPVYDGWQIGGKLLTSIDNKLYMTIGDAKQPKHPEYHPDWDASSTPKPLDLNWYNGKIIRINFDGSVPEDNPFAEAPYGKTAKNLIWSIGHRNTQGLVFGENQMLYYSEHGPANDDEVGIISSGSNYGWPTVEGYCNTEEEIEYCNEHTEHKEPIYAWTPTIAPSNMEYYPYSKIPEFENSLLVATLTGNERSGEDIRVLSLNETGDKIINEYILFEDQAYLRIRDLCISDSGDIYFTSSNLILNSNMSLADDDKIFKISYTENTSVTGINKKSQIPIVLYPNPSKDYINIDCENCNGKFITIKDILGQSLQSSTLTDSKIRFNFPYEKYNLLLIYMDEAFIGKVIIKP
ncbi:PQQ-dependent sugar dehydrogenase [Chondrinema litorale]|uniref:PQQ-dependent sugar dehydrogenase n=1 Tax=Chondrinema litorale TaxID=2994555 RepID=UPI0025436AB0|nr:PQQ-dependent sugar dehydrogenase [Chondrinema litorale]UZR95015.1 PQQ-dependent sugar dehydrogenase [Chondrinema litorale]